MKAWRNLIKSYDNVKQSSVSKEKNVDGLGICVVPATSIGVYINIYIYKNYTERHCKF